MIDVQAIIDRTNRYYDEELRHLGGGHPEPTGTRPSNDPGLVVPMLVAIAEQLNRIEMKLDGVCPGCKIKPKPPVICDADRSFPEWSAKQREHGFDPANGHRLGCPEVG